MIIALRTQLNVKAVVAAFNQEKALVGAFSVIVNRLWNRWIDLRHYSLQINCFVCRRQKLCHFNCGENVTK